MNELPETVAAVDLGSNSFHMLVARYAEGELTVVDRLREMVQLASGLDESRRIGRAAQDRALDCLRRFGERLRHLPPDTVRAVGTNTLRSAHNASEFLVEAQAALGHSIETISGMEEARLIYLGVAHSTANPSSRRLVVDIGGGSTEVIVGESFRPVDMESLYMGCVGMSREHFPGGEIGAASWRRAELAALRELEPVQARFRNLGWEEVVGASGTIRSIDTVVRAEGWTKQGIKLAALRKLRDALLKAGNVTRLRLDGLSPGRLAVFPGGTVVLLAVFEALGIEELQVSDGALREGLLYDLLGRIRAEDVRGRSVDALAERYHVDWKQLARVECTALKMFVAVAEDWALPDKESRQWLRWAARLHEIGLDVAHDRYHKHGEYIVEKCDLPGFSREEQKLLAVLVRAHRRKFPVALFKTLPTPWAKPIERLSVLLRLATILHRSRNPDPLPEIALAAGKKSLRLVFPDGWLDEHPLTRAGLEQEAAYLAAGGIELEFG